MGLQRIRVPHVPLSVTINVATYEALAALAEASESTLVAVVRDAIAAGLPLIRERYAPLSNEVAP